MTPSHLPTGATAILLAGGLGTRLRAAVADRPKVMAEVLGRPFLMYLLDQIAVAGFRHAILCTGYRGAEIRERLRDAYGAVQLRYSQEETPLGTGGALRLAADMIPTDFALVMNGDSYCDVPLACFCQWSTERAAKAALVVTRVEDASRYGTVILNDKQQVTGFAEKKADGHAGWINAGIYWIARSLLRTIPRQGSVSLERDIFPSWTGCGMAAYQHTGHFLDIGTPDSYALAEDFFTHMERLKA